MFINLVFFIEKLRCGVRGVTFLFLYRSLKSCLSLYTSLKEIDIYQCLLIKKMIVSYKVFCSFLLGAGKLYLRLCLSSCISKDLQVFNLIYAARIETVSSICIQEYCEYISVFVYVVTYAYSCLCYMMGEV